MYKNPFFTMHPVSLNESTYDLATGGGPEMVHANTTTDSDPRQDTFCHASAQEQELAGASNTTPPVLQRGPALVDDTFYGPTEEDEPVGCDEKSRSILESFGLPCGKFSLTSKYSDLEVSRLEFMARVKSGPDVGGRSVTFTVPPVASASVKAPPPPKSDEIAVDEAPNELEIDEVSDSPISTKALRESSGSSLSAEELADFRKAIGEGLDLDEAPPVAGVKTFSLNDPTCKAVYDRICFLPDISEYVPKISMPHVGTDWAKQFIEEQQEKLSRTEFPTFNAETISKIVESDVYFWISKGLEAAYAVDDVHYAFILKSVFDRYSREIILSGGTFAKILSKALESLYEVLKGCFNKAKDAAKFTANVFSAPVGYTAEGAFVEGAAEYIKNSNALIRFLSNKKALGHLTKVLCVGILGVMTYVYGHSDQFTWDNVTAYWEHLNKHFTESTLSCFLKVAGIGFETIRAYNACPMGLKFTEFISMCNEVGSELERGETLLEMSKSWNVIGVSEHDKWIANYEAFMLHCEVVLGSERKWNAGNMFLKNSASTLNRMKQLHMKLKTHYVTVMRGTHRRAPFSVMYLAGTSVGKSFITQNTLHLILSKLGVEAKHHARYTYQWSPDEEYASGLKNDVKAIVLDDVAALRPQVFQGSVDPHIAAFLRLINNVSYAPNMAAVEDKGNIFATPDILVGTSNVPNLHLSNFYQHDVVALRRIKHLVTVKVRDEFSDGNGLLDVEKAAAFARDNPNGIMNAWNFRVTTYRGKNHVAGSTITIAKEAVNSDWMDTHAYYKWLDKAFDKHRAEQDNYLTHANADFDWSSIGITVPKPGVEPIGDLKPVKAPTGINQQDGETTCYFHGNGAHCSTVWATDVVVPFFTTVSGVISAVASMCIFIWFFFRRQIIEQIESTHDIVAATASAARLVITHTTAWDACRLYCSEKYRSFMNWISSAIAVLIAMAKYIAAVAMIALLYRQIYASKEATVSVTPQGGGPNSATKVRCEPNASVQQPPVAANAGRVPCDIPEHEMDSAPAYSIPLGCVPCASLTTESKSLHGDTLGDLVEKQTYSVIFESKPLIDDSFVSTVIRMGLNEVDTYTERYNAICFFTKQRALIINKHYIPWYNAKRFKSETWAAGWTMTIKGAGLNNLDVVVTAEDFKKFHRCEPARDLVYLTVPKARPHRDLQKFFMLRPSKLNSHAFPQGAKITFVKKGAGRPSGFIVDTVGYDAVGRAIGAEDPYDMMYTRVVLDHPTVGGDCGNAYLLMKEGTAVAILGIHFGVQDADPRQKLFVPVFANDFISGEPEELPIGEPSEINGITQQDGSPISLIFDRGDPVIGGMFVHNAPRVWETNWPQKNEDWVFEKTEVVVNPDSFKALGQMSSLSGNLKSKFKDSPLKELFLASDSTGLPGPIETDKVALQGEYTQTRSKRNLSAVHAIGKLMGHPSYDEGLANELLDASDMYLQSVLEYKEILPHMRPYNLDVAINGRRMAGQDKFLRTLNPIEMNTSAGYPFVSSGSGSLGKKPWFDKDLDGNYSMVPALAESYERLKESVSNGPVKIVYRMVPKDEVRSEKKVRQGKIRMIMVGPIDSTILIRQFLLCLCRTMAIFPFVFGAAVGVDATSIQWAQIYNFVAGPGFSSFDGDYEDFDKSLIQEIIKAIMHFVEGLCAASGNFSEKDRFIIHNLLMAILSPVVDVFGILYWFRALNTSGNPLTTQINCIAGMILIWYAFIRRMKRDMGAKYTPEFAKAMFKRFIRAITYGDDNIIGTRLSSMFSCVIMQQELAHILVYTDANKNKVANPFTTRDQLQFLGRRFISDYAGRIVPPLEWKRIIKMFMFYRVRAGVDYTQVLGPVYRGAFMEIYFHGKDVYDRMFSIVRGVLSEHFQIEPSLAVDLFLSHSEGVLTYEFFDGWYSAKANEGFIFDPKYAEEYSDEELDSYRAEYFRRVDSNSN